MRFARLAGSVAIALGLSACRVLDRVVGLPSTDGFSLAIEGNDRLTDRALAKAIRLDLMDWRESDFSQAYADDAAYALVQHYISQGYPDAQVTFDVDRSEDSPRLVFQVVEGQQTVVEEFDFPGFTALHGRAARTGADDLLPGDLASFYRAPRTGLAGQGPPVYVASSARTLRGKLLDELRARGHLDAKAGALDVRWSADRTSVALQIPLDPGPAFYLKSANLSGELPPDLDLDAVALRVVRSEGSSRPYSPDLVPELRGILIGHLRDAGYADAQVDVQALIQHDPPAVRLEARVRAGEAVRIRSVLVEGRTPGHEAFVRERILLEPGALARQDRIGSGVSRLYRSGLFRRVDAELRGEGTERDLAIVVDQRPSRELFLEPGYGSYELLRVRGGARERDLWGTGRGLRTELTAAFRAQHALLALTDPEILGPFDKGELTLDYDRREWPSFTAVSRGVGFFITHDWNRSGRRATTYGYQYRQSDLEDVDVLADEIADAVDDVPLSGLRVSHVDDRRDLPLFPRSGTLLQLSSEWGDGSIGSGLDYVRLTAAGAAYFPVDENRVLAVGVRAGTIRTTDGSQTIPIQERFFLGGENSVRAYRESELGPTDSADNPIGGEAFTLASLELRQDLGETSWQLAGFLDTGSVSADTSDVLDLEGYGWGVGAGLRYLLPVGPIRLDLGWNPDASSSEDNLVLHLAVGLAF